MIAVIDYGCGNLFSLSSSLKSLGQQVVITGDRAVLDRADRLILPGVGAFGDAADKLRQTGLDQAVLQAAKEGKFILGICLGMQLLFEKSYEYGTHTGLGLLPGEICPLAGDIAPELKIPHMGWNSITVNKNSRILKNIGSEPYVYFVHSYYVNAEDESIISAYTEYGQKLDIAVEKDNVFATQFHPEKSGETGMTILKNFIAL